MSKRRKAKVMRTVHSLKVERSDINSDMYTVEITNKYKMHKSHWVNQLIDNLGELKTFEARVEATKAALNDLREAIPKQEEALVQDKHDLDSVKENYESWLPEWKQYYALAKEDEKDHAYIVKHLNNAGYKLLNDSGDVARMSEQELMEFKEKQRKGDK